MIWDGSELQAEHEDWERISRGRSRLAVGFERVEGFLWIHRHGSIDIGCAVSGHTLCAAEDGGVEPGCVRRGTELEKEYGAENESVGRTA